MDISIRSCLTAGVATITAAAIIFVPSVAETPPPAAPPAQVQVVSPPITLTAQVQPVVTATDLPGLLVEWLQRIIVPPSASQPVPTPQFPPVVAPTSIGSSIKSVYNAVEPWVRWGFDLAAYAVGWVPYVGWLAPPDHDLLQLRRTHRTQHHVQHRRLARREDQLGPGIGQRRHRHHQLVHLPGQ